MTNPPQLTSQPTGRSLGNVPRLETFTGTLGNVRAVEPVAADATVRAYAQQANALGRASDTFARIADNAIAAEEAAKRENAATNTKRAKAMKKILEQQGAMMPATFASAGVAQSASSSIASFSEQAASSQDFKAMTSGYKEESTKGMEPEVAQTLMDLYDIESGPYLEALEFDEAMEAADAAKQNLNGAIEAAQAEAIRNSLAETPAQRMSMSSGMQKFESFLEASDLTPEERQLMRLDLQNAMTSAALMDDVLTSSNPAMRGIEIAQGMTGTPDIDTLPVGVRMKALDAGLRIQNALSSMTNQARAEREYQQGRAVVQDLITLYGTNDPEARLGVANGLFDFAERTGSPAILNQAIKAQRFAEKKNDEVFTKDTDKNFAALLVSATTRGLITPDEAEDLAAANVGTLISRNTMTQVLAAAQGSRSATFSGNNMEVINGIARGSFPGAFKKSDPMADLMAAISGQPVEMSAAESDDLERHRQFMLELRTDPTVTEANVISKARDLANRYTQSKAQADVITPAPVERDKIDSKYAPELLDSLTESQRSSYESGKRSADATALLPKYINDLDAFRADFVNGKLDEATANALANLLLPQLLKEQQGR